MEIVPDSTLNLTAIGSQLQPSYQYSVSNENPSYTDYKPMEMELIPLPRAVIYLLMAGVVVVAAAYAIVGHLIKDLAHDIADCILGPQSESKLFPAHDLPPMRKCLLPLSTDKMNIYCLPDQPTEVCVPISTSQEIPTNLTHLPSSYGRECGQRKSSLLNV
ncbi:small integral membrane protein 44 isoform X2 [Dendropsophus ebraccatus]